MEAYLDIEEAINETTNYKDLFQKYYQREKKCTPVYEMLSNDPKKNEITVVVCDPDGTRLAFGSGSTRKKAEQMAAREALTETPSQESSRCP
jgi:dsRNA-specific ribonuclease